MPLRAPKEKHWIAGAIKHPGSLTRAAEKHGESTHQEAEHEADPRIRRNVSAGH